MSIMPNVATILKDHVTLEVEGINRMYLNVYIPRLQILEVEKSSHDCILAEEVFQQINRPARWPRNGLPLFADPKVQSSVERLAAVPPVAQRFLAPGPARAFGFAPGPTSRTTDSRPDDLSLAATSPARDHRTGSPNASLPGHPIRPAGRAVFHPYLQSHPAAWPGPSPTHTPGHDRLAPPLLQPTPTGGRRMRHERKTRGLKLDSFAPSSVLL